ncbi:MAG: type II toxin-antitoxin system HicA family toxin [Rhizobiaceae bacterium]|nr:type II toxin-antitoxin system HicA family toxin [Rhizobiaceae bacterium]
MLAIFREPVSGSIVWSDVESLLIAIGCTVVEGNGSRVRFEKDGLLAIFHRPHPEKEAKRYQVRDARRFLEMLGIVP